VGSENRVLKIPHRYVGGVACLAAGLLLRWALDPWVRTQAPLFTFYLAILVSARFFGPGPAVLVAVGGWMATTLLFGPADPPRAMIFLLASGVTVWVVELLRRAFARARENQRTADERLERLQNDTAIHEKEQQHAAQLRAIVESSADAIISKDLDGVIQSWNQGAEQIFGYTSEEAVGKPISIVVPPGRAHEEIDIIERIRRGGRIKHFETVRARKDGDQIHVSLTISPILDAEGRTVGASQIARDITERKMLEEQLLQTQKLESLGVLAGGLAHDFNNLLTGIMGNASLAMEDVRSDERLRVRIVEILSASERAALLIRQMLAYAGKGRFIVKPLDLSVQVQEIVPLLRTSMPRLVQLDLRLAADLPRVEADPSQIHQLIMNLAINGAEAIGEQPGTVTIATSARETNSEWQVVLEVSDTGCGMDDDTKSRIFDPFFTTKFTGRGLGLAAVMGIIRAHNGTISVDTAPGRGTRCRVILPAAPAAVAAEQEAESPGGLRSSSELRGYGNVLVVDDEELICNMARFTLEQCGYAIEVASDGRLAVEAFEKRPHEYAAVLLDLTMPVMDGEEALRRIQEIRPDVPVVLSSGYTESEAMRRFRHRGLAGFLQKPYTATALARKIKQAVRLNTAGEAAGQL
jgi:two-component system CheB/CheR fusion protein